MAGNLLRTAVVSAFALVCGAVVSAQTLVPAPIPSSPTGHCNGAVLTTGGKVYAWGGYAGNTFTPELDAYDPATRSWTPLQPAGNLWRRGGMGEFELGGDLYFVGGEGPNAGSFSNSVFRYLVQSSTWQQCTINFPQNAWDVMCAVVEGRPFAFGGRHGYGQTHPENREFLGWTSGWASRAAMPYHVRQAGVAVHNGKIYVFGGDHMTSEQSHEYVRHIQVYDPSTDTWTFQPDAMPWRLLVGVKAVAYTDRIHVFSARIWNGNEWVDNKAVYVYSPDTGTWFDVEFLPPFLNYWLNEPVLIDGYVYVASDNNPASDAMRIPLRRPAVLGDTNDDLQVDFNDINPFVELLSGL